MNTPNSPASSSSFRVIVVGGGVAGLTASHCLQRAGIDHVVLERHREIAPAIGSSIGLYPHASRILHQLGCLADIEAETTPCKRWLHKKFDGSTIFADEFFRRLRQSHGKDILVLERRRGLQVLYDRLPDKTPIRTGCRVRSIVHNNDGVEVILDDGSIEKGDMIIGCDGVHSIVRQQMWDIADRERPGYIKSREKSSMKVTWKCLNGFGPHQPGMAELSGTSVSGKRQSFLGLSQPDNTFWFYFFKLDEPLPIDDAVYTEKEAEALAATVADVPVGENLTFGQIWQTRTRGNLVSLEEGVLEHWHYGRIVLAGDSAHKFTPQAGMGANVAIEAIAVICNKLQAALVQSEGKKLSLEELERLFSEYEEERSSRTAFVSIMSASFARMEAWTSWPYKILSTCVFPLVPDWMLEKVIGSFIQAAPKVAYVDELGFPAGTRPWKHA